MNDSETKPRARRRGLVVVTLLVLVAALAWWIWTRVLGTPTETTDNAYVQGHMVQLTPQLPGMVVSIAAEDTDLVEAGQLLVRLDDVDARLSIEQASAALAQAVREVRGLYSNRDSVGSGVRAREAEVARVQTEIQRLQGDVDRRSALARSGAVSIEEVTHAREQLAAARSSLASAQAALAVSRDQLSGARTMTENTSISDHPAVLRAAGRLREALLARTRTELRAPVRGYVARRNVQLGQRVQPGTPLMSIIALDEVWVDANFKESQLAHMRIGQPAELSSDLYGDEVRYRGKVVGMGAGTGAAFALIPAQNATGNWIKVVQRVPVRIALEPEELKSHPLRVGLSMEARVNVQDTQGAMLAAAARKDSGETLKPDQAGEAQADEMIRDIIARNSQSGA